MAKDDEKIDGLSLSGSGALDKPDTIIGPGTAVPKTAIDAAGESKKLAANDKIGTGADLDGESPVVNSQPPHPDPWIKHLVHLFNPYFLLLVLVLVVAAGIVMGAYRLNKQKATPTVPSQTLTQEALDSVKNSDATIGDPKHILSIQSNADFTGSVLIRKDLDVAGTIKVGGALNLPGISVSGNSNFDSIQANKLSISGDTSIQGGLTVQKNLSVSGNLIVGGTLSVTTLSIDNLKLNKDLQLVQHLDPIGLAPAKSNGGQIGTGGTTSLSGSDTAGTASFNIGSGAAAGCYITVTFESKFNATPHVVITPVGSGSVGLNYYVNRSTTSFSVCATNAPTPGSSYTFDYIVID